MSRNVALMISYNNIDLTRAAVASVLAQDIPGGVELWFVDNGSTDGTHDWAQEQAEVGLFAYYEHWSENVSPVQIGNTLLAKAFVEGADYVLGVPNDAILPSNLYREFVACPRGVVTGSQTSDMAEFQKYDPAAATPAQATSENTPMAVVLLRRWCYEAILAKNSGKFFFCEDYFHYCSDNHFALDLAACGIRGVQLDLPYYHYCSASYRRNSTSAAANLICAQADRDRAAFAKRWGFRVDDPVYSLAAQDINFRG